MAYRTDRHANPIAVSNAKQKWLDTLNKFKIPFSLGDKFPLSDLRTLRFATPEIGQEAARIILGHTDAFYWYKKSTGKDIIKCYNILTPKHFREQTRYLQNEIINDIYKHERGDGKLLIKNIMELVRDTKSGGFYFQKAGTNKIQKITPENAPMAMLTIFSRQIGVRDLDPKKIKDNFVETNEFF